MTGYPGAPPYGGQYGNVPYGNPFPPNFAFHNMIPPPPPPQFGHQQSPFPANQFAPGTQMQYGNSMAYQNNAQYQQQLGQAQYPQAQAPAFYNPYVPTNMPPPYGNTYNQAPFAEAASAQQPQNVASRNQIAPVFNIPVTDPRNSNRSQAETSGTSSPFQTSKDTALVALQQQGYPPQFSAPRRESSAALEIQDRENDNPTAFDSSKTDHHNTQDKTAPVLPNESETEARPAMDGADDSYSDSEKSFDPYSVTASHTPNAIVDVSAIPSPKPKGVSAATLPGLEPGFAEPMQSEVEITHEQKRTLAIQAIQDLASRQIGFEQMSKEDIDTALLKDLYLESGVPLVLPTDTPNRAAEPSMEPSASSSNALPGKITESLAEPKKSIPAAPTAKRPTPANPDVPTITAVPNFNSPIVSMTSNNLPKPTLQTSAAATVNSNAGMTKDTNENTTPTTNISRQDYLAKLQAAKEAVKSKPVPPTAPAPVPDRSDYLAKLQAAKEAVKQSSVVKSPSTQNPATTSQQDALAMPLVNTAPAQRSENNSTPTRASIDALLRQKLEALRKTQSTTISSLPTASGASVPANLQPAQDAQIFSSGQVLDRQEVTLPSSSSNIEQAKVLDASVLSSGITSGLPGLPGLPGLTSELAPTVLVPSSQYQPTTSAQISAGNFPMLNQLLPYYAPYASAPTDQTSDQQALLENKQARKRPVASDFIEPSAKVQRLSDQEASSLDVESGEVEIENVNGQAGDLGYHVKPFEQISGYGLPPRPDFPPRNNSYQNSQHDVNPDLQAKEDEIRQLRQRIAEATLRKIGKNATATPTASKPTTPSNPEVVSLAPEIEQAQRLQKQDNAIKMGTQELTVQEKILAAAKLQAQKHLEQIRRGQTNLNVQATKTQNEADHASSDAEREQKLQRKANLEAKLTSINAVISTTETDLARIKEEQDKLLGRIQQENDARSALLDEIKELLQDLETVVPPTTIDAVRNTNEAEVIVAQSKMDDTPLEVFHEEESDSGIRPYPIQPDSEHASQQPVPISLSSTTVTSGTVSPQQHIDSQDDMGSVAEDEGEEQMEIDDDSIDMDEDEDEYDPETADIDYGHPLEPEFRETNDGSLDDGQDDYEPVQDIEVLPVISDTELDLSDRDQDRQSSDQDAAMDEESSASVSISSSDNAYGVEDAEDENDSNDNLGSPDPHTVILPEATPNTVLTAQPSISTSVVDVPQEHEMEALSQSEHNEISTNHLDEGSNTTLQPDNTMVDDGNNETGESPNLATFMESAPALQQHFVPYESPLTQFKSYRFQPQFLENTAGGFRSLTYSHKINPNVEFCKWELAGGSCNDPGCDAQHFKDVTLTDNNLLLQLGSTHEGTTQAEREAYVAGLKSTIFAMRAKGLKDVNSIASEIVAYRRKFLDDPTRVITNLDN